jgi:DNA-binding transcriptional MocR family regulator
LRVSPPGQDRRCEPVEDDYDAEFNYDRLAPAAMQGMDPDRVALLGSMSNP